jgi:hypothetical protein
MGAVLHEDSVAGEDSAAHSMAGCTKRTGASVPKMPPAYLMNICEKSSSLSNMMLARLGTSGNLANIGEDPHGILNGQTYRGKP